jgi:hypothetical protein
VPDFSDIFRNSYDLAKFIEVATFHQLYAQKSAKILDMFKGGEKIRQALVRFCLLLFRAFI